VPDDLPGPGPGPVLLAVLSAAAAGVGVVLAPVGLLVALALGVVAGLIGVAVVLAPSAHGPDHPPDSTDDPADHPATGPAQPEIGRRELSARVNERGVEKPWVAAAARDWGRRSPGPTDHPRRRPYRARRCRTGPPWPAPAGRGRRAGPRHPAHRGAAVGLGDLDPVATGRGAHGGVRVAEQRFPQLVTDPDPRVRRKVARSRWVSPLILRRLTSGQDSRHRRHRRAPGHRTAGQNPLLVAARAAPGLGQRPVVAGAADGAVGPAASDVFGQAAADAVADEPAFVPVGGRGALVRP